jgi:hypothetical protein
MKNRAFLRLLRRNGLLCRKTKPNPFARLKTERTVMPDREYSFTEISENVHHQVIADQPDTLEIKFLDEKFGKDRYNGNGISKILKEYRLWLEQNEKI